MIFLDILPTYHVWNTWENRGKFAILLVSAVEYLLSLGVNVDQPSRRTGHALHEANHYELGNRSKAMQMLLDCGVNPDLRCGKYETALQAVAKHVNLENVRVPAQCRGGPNYRWREGSRRRRWHSTSITMSPISWRGIWQPGESKVSHSNIIKIRNFKAVKSNLWEGRKNANLGFFAGFV